MHYSSSQKEKVQGAPSSSKVPNQKADTKIASRARKCFVQAGDAAKKTDAMNIQRAPYMLKLKEFDDAAKIINLLK